MSGVDAYAQQMDRLLAGARALFPEDGHASVATPEVAPTESLSAPEEASGLGSTVVQASSGYHGAQSRAGDVSTDMHAVAEAARASAHEAGGSAAGIRRAAAVHAAAIGPETASPEAVVLLVTSMDERLAQMQDHLAASKAALEDAARRVQVHGHTLAGLGHR